MTGLFDLHGKVVLATGAASGIGLGFLRGCARQGAEVVIWDKAREKSYEAAELLRSLGAPRCHVEIVDVSQEGQVEAAFGSTLAAMGRVDCVFANAGVHSSAPAFPDMTSQTYLDVIAVNQHGAFFTLRAAAQHMRARAMAGDPGGSLVACGSLSIFRGRAGIQHYAASKGALLAMIRGLAAELGQYGIRANMLAPGFIMTDMTASDEDTDTTARHFAAITPLGRPGFIEDIEGPAAYLASDASSFQTGDVLTIDGGRTIRA